MVVLVTLVAAVAGIAFGSRVDAAQRVAYWGVPVLLAIPVVATALVLVGVAYLPFSLYSYVLASFGLSRGLSVALLILPPLCLAIACAMRPGKKSYALAAAWCLLMLVDCALFFFFEESTLLILAALALSCAGLVASGRPARREEPEAAGDAPDAEAVAPTLYESVPTDPTQAYVIVEPPVGAAQDEGAPVAAEPEEPAEPAQKTGSGWTARHVIALMIGTFAFFCLVRVAMGYPLLPQLGGSTSAVETTADGGSGGSSSDSGSSSNFGPGSFSDLSDEELEIAEYLESRGFSGEVLADGSASDDDLAIVSLRAGMTDCAFGYQCIGTDGETLEQTILDDGLYVVWPPTCLTESSDGTFRSIVVSEPSVFWDVTYALYEGGYYVSDDWTTALWTSCGERPCRSFVSELMYALDESTDSFDGEDWMGETHAASLLLYQYLSDWSLFFGEPFSVACGCCDFSARGPA